MRFEKKGSGAIIFVGEIAVKASSVDRAFGMSTLCKRLGDFVPAPAAETEKQIDTPPPPLPPEPVSAVNLEEWQQYQEEKKELLESLELYYRVFFLGEEVPEEALMEEDGEKPNGK